MGRPNASDRRKVRIERKKKEASKDAKIASKAKSARERAALEREEEDIDAILAEFAAQSASVDDTINVTVCDMPPSKRCNFTISALPERNELMLFGGEYFDGKNMYVYGDFFHYLPQKDEWRLLKSQCSPPPRCGHAAAVRAAMGGQLWIFGGEFSSKTQSTFRHYGDLWIYHCKENKWERVEPKQEAGKSAVWPSPRSGHRMTFVGNNLVLFGGFFDNNKSMPRYYNDVFIFDLDMYEWRNIVFPTVMLMPSPRSACHLVTYGEKVVLLGGYSRIRIKGDQDKGKQHDDSWELSTVVTEQVKSSAVQWQWTRLHLSGAAPVSLVGGAVVMRSQSQLLWFGGCLDAEEELSMKSMFSCELHSLDLETHRWHCVRTKRGSAMREMMQTQQEQSFRKAVAEATEALAKKRAAAKLKKGNSAKSPAVVSSVSKSTIDNSKGTASDGGLNSSNSVIGTGSTVADSVSWPSPRKSPGVAIRKGVLWMYGGYIESDDRQVVLDDLWSLDLKALDSWTEVYAGSKEPGEWLEDASSSGSSDSDSD